jgi:O-antigen chain-terminating methyltransferase
MRRVIEKLSHERKEKEEVFAEKAQKLKEKNKDDTASQKSLRLEHLLSRLEDSLKPKEKPSPKKGIFPFFAKTPAKDSVQQVFNQQVFHILKEFKEILVQNLNQTKEAVAALTDLLELNVSLMDAKDKEWDALENNHVGMIFKSMEWKIDKLAAEYGDVKILMKKFLLLKENLTRLLAALEEKKIPAAPEVKEMLEPLEDWHYARFENRYRGYEEEVKKQQASYISLFKKGGKVLDLGCGRGEFLSLLNENGIDAIGIDGNSLMVDNCMDKGLNCRKGDILEELTKIEDGSLSGVFSSQVIEHLPPAYLRRMVELAYFKIAPEGRIVLETINPTSVFTLVQVYYLDLAHQKPIHPQALQFLLESAGFVDIEIKFSPPLEQERLQNLPGADEFSSILNQNIDNLNRLLYASPNYAAIGIKK